LPQAKGRNLPKESTIKFLNYCLKNACAILEELSPAIDFLKFNPVNRALFLSQCRAGSRKRRKERETERARGEDFFSSFPNPAAVSRPALLPLLSIFGISQRKLSFLAK
jgi:hypothetical protein